MSPPILSTTITPKTLKASFEALTRSKPMPDNPLTSLTLVQQHYLEWNGLINHQQALFDVLADVLTDEFNRLRGLYGWPPVDTTCGLEAAQADLSLMGSSVNKCLLACSVIYYRYVRGDLALLWEDIFMYLGYDGREIRRYRNDFWYYLCHVFSRAEHQAQDMARQLRCQLALPRRLLIHLKRQDQLALSLIRRLTQLDWPCLFIYGPAGIGKTVLALRLVEHAIDRQQVDHVIWVDMTSLCQRTQPLTCEGLAERLCQHIGLNRHSENLFIDTLLDYVHHHIALDKTIQIVIDGADTCEAAIAGLWHILCHCRFVVTSRRQFPEWHGLSYACPPLARQDMLALLRFWDGNRHLHVPWRDCEAAYERLAARANHNPSRLRHSLDLLHFLQRPLELASPPT